MAQYINCAVHVKIHIKFGKHCNLTVYALVNHNGFHGTENLYIFYQITLL